MISDSFYRKKCSCDLKLIAIKFNHDIADLTTDAINVRKNFTAAVSVPEWTSGVTVAADSPAAYAILETQGNKITIKAKFAIGPMNALQAEIKADGGGILGALDAQTVNFAAGVSTPEFVSFELRHHTIGNDGIKLEDITWNWKYRCCGGSQWEPLATTHHRIYVILEEPKLPWKQQPFPNDQNPWTEALDYACTWAAGQKTRDDAATAITKAINGSLGLVYDNASGASHYTSGFLAIFELTQFLAYLTSGTGLGHIVNCTDCATITTTFSNLVGCDLHASKMGTFFALTPFRGIGAGAFGCPGFGCSFSFHEVAWKGGHGNSDPLFDACLRVDGDSNPWSAPYSEIFPVNIVFSTNPGAPLPLAVPFNDQSYKERLCTNDAAGIGKCNPIGPWPSSSNGRRPVK
ncbi:MAG TPA: hypothetical protein VN696_05180 [Pyrinomonadaceae bacterium]|nr:hypothetical protein [Pyrinomonadaceae bacterium]